jgi:hypothetical protein
VTDQDGLFETPAPAAPEHPDAAVARRIVGDYLQGEVETARKALEDAQAAYHRERDQLDAWEQRGEIKSRMVGRVDLTVFAILSRADTLYHAAARAAIPEMGGRYTPEGRDAAYQAREDSRAVRRWLRDQGYVIPGDDDGRVASTSSRRRKGDAR